MSEPSLFRRLFLSILIMLAALFIIGAGLALRNTSGQIDADSDAQLIADSHTVWTLVREDLEEGDSLGDMHLDFSAPMLNERDRQTLSEYARRRAVRIWKDDKLSAQSENLKKIDLPKRLAGFTDQAIDGEMWRIYTVYVPDNKITVEIWENKRNRERLLMGIATGIAAAGIVILPLLVILLIVSIRYGMRSLLLLAHKVKNRKSDDLSPLGIERLPRELTPLQRAINMLLGKLSYHVAHERQFMDNLAHELRTPLAALKLQGELVAMAPNEAARESCVKDLIKGIDRASHMFDQILLFSRLSQQSLQISSFAAAPLLQDVISQRMAIATQKHIEIALNAPPDVHLHSNPELLKIMLGALLDNAIKYTPEGGMIHLVAAPGVLTLTDNGPGVPMQERTRVFERFTRGKTAQQEGSGLGLAIAREIGGLLDIDITLDHPETHTGLVVRLTFMPK